MAGLQKLLRLARLLQALLGEVLMLGTAALADRRSPDLLRPSSFFSTSQFSQVFPASLAGKNMLHRPYYSCFYPIRSTSSKCHSSYAQGYRKGSGAVTCGTMT